MGCQDLLEDVPGRPKKESDGSSSPMDLKFFKKGSSILIFLRNPIKPYNKHRCRSNGSKFLKKLQR